jgi:uncharacterized membrane protein YbjE (DUF340 family)
MKKMNFSRFENMYFFAVFAAFGIYAYNVQENWIIDVGEQLYNLMFFGLLFFIGMILTGIKVASKDGKVNKKSIVFAISIALLIVIWRVLLIVL